MLIPPATIDILTHPEDIIVRQGEKHLIPAEVDTHFSNNVTTITFDNETDFSSNGLHVSTPRIQPPLFEVEVSPQTPIGVYTIPFVASMIISTTYSTSPTATPATATVDTVTEVLDPEFQVSKKYPTIGYITSPGNLTINVIPPLTVNETFTAFWVTYGTPLVGLTGVVVGVFSTFVIDHLKSRREHK